MRSNSAAILLLSREADTIEELVEILSTSTADVEYRIETGTSLRVNSSFLLAPLLLQKEPELVEIPKFGPLLSLETIMNANDSLQVYM